MMTTPEEVTLSTRPQPVSATWTVPAASTVLHDMGTTDYTDNDGFEKHTWNCFRAPGLRNV